MAGDKVKPEIWEVFARGRAWRQNQTQSPACLASYMSTGWCLFHCMG